MRQSLDATATWRTGDDLAERTELSLRMAKKQPPNSKTPARWRKNEEIWSGGEEE
jgi:hypothetical protein